MTEPTHVPTPGVLPRLVEELCEQLVPACQAHYGEDLWSVVLYGSAARGTPRPDSDVDVLIVAEGLPRGRVHRASDFEPVESALEPILSSGRELGVDWYLSPVFKTPEEASAGSPLFLDMTEDARLLIDRDGFFAGVLEGLRSRLRALGSRRVWRGDAWFWDLKPDYVPGEIFEL